MGWAGQQISNFVFMSYGLFWPFQGDPWLKNATNDISIQEFHNVMAHYKRHYSLPMQCKLMVIGGPPFIVHKLMLLRGRPPILLHKLMLLRGGLSYL